MFSRAIFIFFVQIIVSNWLLNANKDAPLHTKGSLIWRLPAHCFRANVSCGSGSAWRGAERFSFWFLERTFSNLNLKKGDIIIIKTNNKQNPHSHSLEIFSLSITNEKKEFKLKKKHTHNNQFKLKNNYYGTKE